MAMDIHLKKKPRLAMEIPDLPKEVLHRIQHFLNAKEAAQTTILSKSWCGAWSTRPDLDLDLRCFSYRMDEFSEFANKTINRYEALNLNIQSFKLWMRPQWNYEPSEGDGLSLATELILKAIKLGATDLQIDFPSSYVNIFHLPLFELPNELLRSQTLARLSVSDFIVDLRGNNNDGVGEDSSSYPNVKSLNLCRVLMNGDFIRDLASRWPLIEELTLERFFETGFEDSETHYRLFKLSMQFLPDCTDVMDTLLWRCDALANFPCLRELVICDRRSYKDLLRICSPSLECIRIRLLDNKIWNVEFDVPNIRIFEYEGSSFSRFQFKATKCKGWESDISITSPGSHDIPGTWFSSLDQLVKMLSLSSSRVYLSLMNVKIPPVESFDGYCRDGVATPAAALEDLTLEGEAVSVAFVENVILSCRPKFIYIEEENVKLFEELRVQPWTTLLDDASTYKQKKKFVRFQLN